VGGRGGRDKQHPPLKPPTMPSFDIPLGPPITERGCTYLMSEAKVCHGKHPTPMPPYGSITYNCEKGEMPLEWVSKNKFLVWLTAKENKNTIKFIVSFTEESHSPNWWAWCMFKCSREFSGGNPDCENTFQWDWKIPLMKMGCQCCLTIKLYLHMETVLRKYESQHNHTLGNDNLRFPSARTQVTARLFTGAQQESSASCTSSQVKCRDII